MIEKLRASRLTRAAELAEKTIEEALTYYAFPEEHWRRICTDNPLGRATPDLPQDVVLPNSVYFIDDY
jgi:putative transposase